MTDSKWKVVSIIVGLVGVVVPITWSWWTGRTSITLRHRSTSVLAQKAEGLDSLEIRWGDEAYPSVAVVNFSLANTGRTSIQARDVSKPPTVEFLNGTVLKAEATSAFPQSAEFTATVDSLGRRVAVPFGLLNPSDRIEFSAIVAATEPQQSTYTPRFEASTRISGVQQLDVEDVAVQDDDVFLPDWSWTVWLVGGMTAFLTLTVFAGFRMLGAELHTKQLVENQALGPPTGLTAEEYRAWMELVLADKTDRQMEDLRAKLSSVSQGQPLDDEEYEEVAMEFYQTATDVSARKLAMFVIVATTAFGYWYVLTTVA